MKQELDIFIRKQKKILISSNMSQEGESQLAKQRPVQGPMAQNRKTKSKDYSRYREKIFFKNLKNPISTSQARNLSIVRNKMINVNRKLFQMRKTEKNSNEWQQIFSTPQNAKK